jgi:hypothetical protein
LYNSPNVITFINSRRITWEGHASRMEESKSSFKILTGKPTLDKLLGRPRRRWKDNVRIDLK